MLRPRSFLLAMLAGLAASQWWQYRTAMPAIDARTRQRLAA